MLQHRYQVMPPLSSDEFEALKADIAARGVKVPVEYDETGQILDGHHRVQACNELGLSNWPRLIRHGLTEEEKRRHARRLNLDRRHLNSDQKRQLIEDELREDPEASDRSIGQNLGVDHKTVGAVRERLEGTGEIPQLSDRVGRDAKRRRITQFVPATDDEERGLKIAAKELNFRQGSEKRERRIQIAQALSDAAAALPSGRKYPVIYADPPWHSDQGVNSRSYENHYPTMPWKDICALPIADMVLPDAWLFLWIPRAHLLASYPMETDVTTMPDGEIARGVVDMPLAAAVARSWGFDAYSTCFVWTKNDDEHPDEAGTGILVRDQDEILLMFKRGQGLPKPVDKFGSNHRERSRPLGHSKKPRHYRTMIAAMSAGLPVLELFARHDPDDPLPPNWDAWGNQADETESRAKATEGKAGMAGGEASVRRSPAGTGLRVGEAGADLPATSEFMDVTAGETAPDQIRSADDGSRIDAGAEGSLAELSHPGSAGMGADGDAAPPAGLPPFSSQLQGTEGA